MKHPNTLLAFGVALCSAASALATDFSFQGSFAKDNDVQLFTFTVGAASPNVILRTWSYAGGVNAAGSTIARGGFDPILAIYNSAGTRIGQNDDGGSPLVGADALTGKYWDTYLNIGALAAGTYTVSIQQYDNSNNGTLANGFVRNGAANNNFTQALTGHATGNFWDVSGTAGSGRDGHWAFDILNVQGATVVGAPDGGSALVLLSLALGAVAAFRRKLQGS